MKKIMSFAFMKVGDILASIDEKKEKKANPYNLPMITKKTMLP